MLDDQENNPESILHVDDLQAEEQELAAQEEAAEQVHPEGRNYTEYELVQLGKGWDPTKEKTAEQWAKDGEWIGKLDTAHKEIRTLKSSIDQLVQYNQTVEQRALKQAREETLRALHYAKENYDMDGVEQATQNLQRIDIEEATRQYQPNQRQPLTEEEVNFTLGLSKINPWLNDPQLHQIAVEEEMAEQRLHPERTKIQNLHTAISRIKASFPELATARDVNSSPGASSRTFDASAKSSMSASSANNYKTQAVFTKLPAHSQEMFRSLKELDSTYTEKQYLDDLRKLGG